MSITARSRAQELPNVEAESQHQTIKAREEEFILLLLLFIGSPQT